MQAPLSCYAIFTLIWTYKIHDLTDHHLTVCSFLAANGCNHFDGKGSKTWNLKVDPILPAAVISLCAFLCWFYLPNSLQSLWDLLEFPCANQAKPIAHNHLNVHFVCCMASHPNHPPAPSSALCQPSYHPSKRLRLEFLCVNLATPMAQNWSFLKLLTLPTAAPPLKLLLPLSLQASFFKGLFLLFSCANPATSQDQSFLKLFLGPPHAPHLKLLCQPLLVSMNQLFSKPPPLVILYNSTLANHFGQSFFETRLNTTKHFKKALQGLQEKSLPVPACQHCQESQLLHCRDRRQRRD